MNRDKIKSILKNVLLPLTIFAILTFIIHPTLFTGFSDKIETNDGRLLAWTLSWNSEKLLSDPLSIFDANIYYPNKNTLTYSEHLIGTTYLVLPIYFLSNGNPTAMFNFLMILSYILNAFCAFWLIKYLTKNYYAALLGAIVFGYCAYRISNIAHLQNMVVFYIPLMMFFLINYFEAKRIRYLILTGLMLLLQSLTSWYHMVFIFILFGLIVLYYIIKKRFSLVDLKRFILMFVILGICIAPFALPYFVFNKESSSAYSIEEVKQYSSDIGGYLFPSPGTFLNNALGIFKVSKSSWSENFNYIGVIPLLLSLLSVFKFNFSRKGINIEFKRSRIKYALGGFVFVILSFGPFLRLDDITTKLPLPYYLLYTFATPIRFIRAVARFATVSFLFVAILSSFGFMDFVKNRSKNFTRVAFALIFILIMLDYIPTKRFDRYTDVSSTPKVYEYIKNTDEVKSLVELPINVDPFVTTGYIYYAGIHYKPILNGYSGYEPEGYSHFRNILTNNLNTVGYLEMKKIDLTHVLVNPGIEIDLDTMLYEKVFQDEGYTLYKIKDTPEEFNFFYDDFQTQVANEFLEPTYKLKSSRINPVNSNTPFASLSPEEVNREAEFKFESQTTFTKIKIGFRAYGEDDKIIIKCGEYAEEFSDISIYLDDPLEVNCGTSTNNFKITMLSKEFNDRSLVKTILVQ